MRYLSIDYGLRRTGLAICDANETVVSPLAVLDSRKDLIQKVIDVIKTETVGAVVVGLPLNMDDSQGPQAKMSLKFTDDLKTHIDIPIHLQDERLSSFAAEEKLDSVGYSRNDKKKRLDAIAAAEILHLFLARKNSNDSADKQQPTQ